MVLLHRSDDDRWVLRRRSKGLIAGAAVAAVAVVAVAVWLALEVRQAWATIDSAAQSFQVPDGFTEVRRIRQGTAFCVVSCSNGGEAIVTIVMHADGLSVEEACAALRVAVGGVSKGTQPGEAVDAFQCVWTGRLDDTATVRGVVAGRSELTPLGPAGVYGPRWTERMAIPDASLLVWVEFNSGIE